MPDNNQSLTVTAKGAAKPPHPMETLRGMLEKALPQIKMALPKHLTAERMLRVANTAIRRTPALLDCDPMTVVGAVVQASQLGLEPDGVLGHAYLVPYRNRKTNRQECQLIVGYRGFIDLARRSGQVVSVAARCVYARDEFSYSFGLDKDELIHKPSMDGDKGDLVCVYAVARFAHGYHFDVMSIADVNAIRKRSKSSDSGPWVTDFDQMACKTVVRRLCKYLPLSPEIQKAVALDELGDAGLPQSLDIEVDSAEVVAEGTRVRQEQLRQRYAGGAATTDVGGDDTPTAGNAEGTRVRQEQLRQRYAGGAATTDVGGDDTPTAGNGEVTPADDGGLL